MKPQMFQNIKVLNNRLGNYRMIDWQGIELQQKIQEQESDYISNYSKIRLKTYKMRLIDSMNFAKPKQSNCKSIVNVIKMY